MNIRIVTPLILSTLLVCCSTQTTTYKTTINLPEKENELLRSSMKVIEGRARAIAQEFKLEDVEVDVNLHRGKNTITLAIENGSEELETAVTTKLAEPFRFEFYKQVDDDIPLEEADIIVGERQGFNKIDLSTKHVAWVSTSEAQSGALVEFTEEGKRIKKELFDALHGKSIGIFVRGQPVYKFLVEGKDIDDNELFIKIPNQELAQVFADDINVGLHVSFTPVQ